MTIKLTPYLMLEGNTKEAIQFYEQALGAIVLELNTYGDMPEMENTFTEDLKDLVAHAKLQIGESELMFSDAPNGSNIPKGKQITIAITTPAVETSKRIFAALEEGGQVNMPLEEHAFSPAFGDVTDKFGITFQVYTEIKS